MPFLHEPEPPRGIPLEILPGITRVVARNPSVMTYHGTNTYLIKADDGITILDPGPNDPQHVQDVIAAAGNVPIKRILLTHTHGDHSGAAKALSEATGLPVQAYKVSTKAGFTPDIPLDDGDMVAGLNALYTPGHAGDHLSYEYMLPDGRKILFSGDHVMSWSSSIVSPPDGDMSAYYRSLELLLNRDEEIYLSGHGPLLENPRELVAELLGHRKRREASILVQLGDKTWSVFELAAKLYNKTDPFLKIAAQRNVIAHLLKLKTEGKVEELSPLEHLPESAPEITGPPGEVRAESGGMVAIMKADALRRFAMAG